MDRYKVYYAKNDSIKEFPATDGIGILDGGEIKILKNGLLIDISHLSDINEIEAYLEKA